MFSLRQQKRNEKWSTIQRRRRRREAIIDTICGILIIPMFYILTVLVFCL